MEIPGAIAGWCFVIRYCFEAAAELGVGGGVREEVQHENFHALIQEPEYQKLYTGK